MIDSPLVKAKELSDKPLGRIPYVVVMRPNYLLASQALTVEDYLASEHIHVSSLSKGRGQMDKTIITLAVKNITHINNIALIFVS
ncbi:MAG: hypothetical protein QMC64_02200 [Porticoccaceae bacterium]